MRWELYLVGRGWRMELMYEGGDVVVEAEIPDLVKTAFVSAPAARWGEGIAVEVRRSRTTTFEEVGDGNVA